MKIMKMKSFNTQKHAFLTHTLSDKALKGIIVNLCMEAEGPLEITLIVPLKGPFTYLGNFRIN